MFQRSSKKRGRTEQRSGADDHQATPAQPFAQVLSPGDMLHLQRTIGNQAVMRLVFGEQTRQAKQRVQRTLEDAIIAVAHLEVNVNLPHSERNMIKAIRGLDAGSARDMLLNALIKGENHQKKRDILDKVNNIPSFSCYSTGRIYNKGEKDDQYGTWESRMIMYIITDARYNDLDVHVSLFPDDTYNDKWNIAYNEASTYLDRGSSIKEANDTAGNIDDHTTMTYNELHVTFGKGSKSIAHYFYSTSGDFIRTDYNDLQMRQFADRVADWFIS